jgi:hypothetical protein
LRQLLGPRFHAGKVHAGTHSTWFKVFGAVRNRGCVLRAVFALLSWLHTIIVARSKPALSAQNMAADARGLFPDGQTHQTRVRRIEAAARQVEQARGDPAAVLGLAPTGECVATARRKYLDLARLLHPDKSFDVPRFNRLFAQIKTAFDAVTTQQKQQPQQHQHPQHSRADQLHRSDTRPAATGTANVPATDPAAAGYRRRRKLPVQCAPHADDNDGAKPNGTADGSAGSSRALICTVPAHAGDVPLHTRTALAAHRLALVEGRRALVPCMPAAEDAQAEAVAPAVRFTSLIATDGAAHTTHQTAAKRDKHHKGLRQRAVARRNAERRLRMHGFSFSGNFRATAASAQ